MQRHFFHLQQLSYLVFLLLPTTLYYVVYVYLYQRGMTWYVFGLNLAAGNIYLSGVPPVPSQ